MAHRKRRAAAVGVTLVGAVSLAAGSAHAAPVISAPFASRFQISNATPVGDGRFITQMAWGPGGRLYITQFDGTPWSYAFNPSTGALFDKRGGGSTRAFGIAFANHATPGEPARDYLYIARNVGFEGIITRLGDNNGNGIWGEAGEVNVDIVRGVPIGDHSLDQVQVSNHTLYVGIGARTNNGRSGPFTGQNIHDTPAGPMGGGFGSGGEGFTYGETSYNGAIGWIKDLRQVANTTSAAQLRDGPNGQSGALMAGRDDFLPSHPRSHLPYSSDAADKLLVHSAGTRNPFGLAIDASGDLWFTNNFGRANSNGDGTSTPSFRDDLDEDLSDDVHDQFFRAVIGGDYRYDNTNFRGSKDFPSNPVVSTTFDNLDSAHPSFGNLHDPANPDGLGPSSSANGLDLGTLDLTGLLATDAREYALVSRWNGTIMEAPPGTDSMTFQDVVVVDPDSGQVRRLAEGFDNPIDVISDGQGGFLVADWGINGTIYRITPRAPSSRWSSTGGGNWSSAGNWSGPVPDAVGAVANFTAAITAQAQINVDAPRVLGTMNFDNANRYTIAGSAVLTIDVAAGFGAINAISGSHTIAAPVHLAKNTTIDVWQSGSTLTMSGDQSASASVTLIKAGPGTLQIKHLRAPMVKLDAGTVRILPSGTSAGTSNVKSLALAGGSTPTPRLDLTNNALVIDHDGASPIATVAAQIRHAYNGGAWDQGGITSSLANANRFALGYAERSTLSSVPDIFGNVDNTAVLVRFTRYGDADLDGLVNLADFNRLAANFGSTNAVWNRGDFNYDGLVNLTDFNLLAGNFGLSASPDGPTPDDWSALASAVPEPGVLPMVAVVGLGLLRRRRSAPPRRAGQKLLAPLVPPWCA